MTTHLTDSQKQKDYDRFMSKVRLNEENGCWEWTGSINNTGYGLFWYRDRVIVAHRFLVGINIEEGRECCHKCDNRKCVNPEHIFIGTHTENMHDCRDKGRINFRPGLKAATGKRKTWHRGSRNHASVLSEDDATLIKSSQNTPGSGAALARHFGVHQTIITRIRKGTGWKHIRVSEEAKIRAASLCRALNLGELGD